MEQKLTLTFTSTMDTELGSGFLFVECFGSGSHILPDINTPWPVTPRADTPRADTPRANTSWADTPLDRHNSWADTPVQADTPPPGRHPLRADTPPPGRHPPPGRLPSGYSPLSRQTPLGQTPPPLPGRHSPTPKTAIALDGTHPSRLHSFWYSIKI